MTKTVTTKQNRRKDGEFTASPTNDADGKPETVTRYEITSADVAKLREAYSEADLGQSTRAAELLKQVLAGLSAA